MTLGFERPTRLFELGAKALQVGGAVWTAGSAAFVLGIAFGPATIRSEREGLVELIGQLALVAGALILFIGVALIALSVIVPRSTRWAFGLMLVGVLLFPLMGLGVPFFFAGTVVLAVTSYRNDALRWATAWLVLAIVVLPYSAIPDPEDAALPLVALSLLAVTQLGLAWFFVGRGLLAGHASSSAAPPRAEESDAGSYEGGVGEGAVQR